MKKQIIQFHVHKGEGQYVAEGIDLPIITQAYTLDELAKNIEEAVALHLEDEELDALNLSDAPSVLVNLELSGLAHA
jgi:predicted RNase H-like HicB family nuclease